MAHGCKGFRVREKSGKSLLCRAMMHGANSKFSKRRLPVDTTILHGKLAVTCKTFAGRVFSGFGRCHARMAATLFHSLAVGGSTLVSDLARILKPGLRAAPKKQREMVSGWLARLELLPAMQEWMGKDAQGWWRDETPVAIDCSDLSKEFGGEGMEGMEWGHDGSTGGESMGHLFVTAAIVPGHLRAAVPVWTRLGRGKHGSTGLMKEGVTRAHELSDGRSVALVDRGGDGLPFLSWLLREGRRAVVRIALLSRDVFGTGRPIDEELARIAFRNVTLQRNSGRTQAAQLRWKLGSLPANLSRKKDAKPDYRPVLVVESHFGGKSIYLYVLIPAAESDDPAALERRARQAAQFYLQRWQIETSFLRLKQDFGLEMARVRTFRRLENLFALCNLAYLFAQFKLRESKEYGLYVKILRDNFETVNLRAEVFLANLRTLLKEHRIRCITGRPRKAARGDPPGQQTFLFA